MTLKEVGIVIGKKLVTRHVLTGKVLVDFEGTELKDRNLLIGVCGRGKTVTQAKTNYCKKIGGQILIMDAMLKTRREIQLPPRITVR